MSIVRPTVKYDGGPAFPCPDKNWVDGMTLRDWFAGKALAGITADSVRNNNLAKQLDEDEAFAQFQAKWAYSLADAMLEARK